MTVFDDIYRTNAWTHGSGPGSLVEPTRTPAMLLRALVAGLGVTSVLDVGCGDGQWMPDLPGYLGVDVSVEAIARSRRAHPGRQYAVYEGGRLMRSGLVIVRDVVQHLSAADGLALMGRAWRAADPWLLMSHYAGGENVDIPTGADAYSPDMLADPFGLPQPVALIFDGYRYHDGASVRDPRKMLALWRTR